MLTAHHLPPEMREIFEQTGYGCLAAETGRQAGKGQSIRQSTTNERNGGNIMRSLVSYLEGAKLHFPLNQYTISEPSWPKIGGPMPRESW